MRQENMGMTEKCPADGRKQLEWLEAIRQPLVRYCLQMTGSPWEAEDLVQDTMVRLLRAVAERPEREIGYRYACRTARNLWIDRCRREKRIMAIAETEAAGSMHAAMDVREHLEELAWRLSPKPFVIMLLMEVFDFTAKETAAWVGGTEAAVQVALSRARSRLQSLSRLGRGDRLTGTGAGSGGGRGRANSAAAGQPPMPAAFFEAVLDAFRRRHPAAIREAYMSLAAAGAKVQQIRALGGKLYFTFRDPDGNLLMVSA